MQRKKTKFRFAIFSVYMQKKKPISSSVSFFCSLISLSVLMLLRPHGYKTFTLQDAP